MRNARLQGFEPQINQLGRGTSVHSVPACQKIHVVVRNVVEKLHDHSENNSRENESILQYFNFS